MAIASSAFSGNPYKLPAGAGEAGMSYVSVMHEGFWSSCNNAALLPGIRKMSFGAAYESRFSLKELGTRTAAMVIPAWRASVGAVYSRFGYSDFSREMLAFSCGLPLSESISAGIQIDYFTQKTAGEYLNSHALTFEAGALFRLPGDVSIGVSAFNPLPGRIRDPGIPSAIRAGAGSKLGSDLFAGFEVEMVTGMKPCLKTGFEYEAARNLWLRGGYRSAESSFSFGLGYIIRPGKIDIAFSTHERLGISSSISLIFEINKK